MSTFSITNINGKRCTAVPKTASTVLSTVTQASTSVLITTTIANTQTTITASAQSSTSSAVVTGTTETTTEASHATSEVAAASSTTSTTQQAQDTAASTTTSTPTATAPTNAPVASSAPAISSPEPTPSTIKASPAISQEQITTLPLVLSSSGTSSTPIGASPTASLSTATGGSSATTIVASAQSEISGSKASDTTNGAHTEIAPKTSSGLSALLPTGTASSVNAPTAAPAIEDNSKDPNSIGPTIGGVIGGIVIIVLIAFLIWWYRKKRRDRRESLLTPLTAPYPLDKSGFYGRTEDRPSTPTSSSERAKVQLGILSRSVGNKFSNLSDNLREKLSSGTPSRINLNRGNSQFMEPINQHSRNNSAASSQAGDMTIGDRLGELLRRLRTNESPSWQSKQALGSPPPFKVVHRTNEIRVVRPDPASNTSAAQHQNIQNSDNLGNLDLDFSGYQAGPTSKQPTNLNLSNSSTLSPQLSVPLPAATLPHTAKTFTLTTPLPTIHESTTSSMYSRPASTTSQTSSSNRSTYSDSRSKRARSDPFDLRPPDLLHYPAEPMPERRFDGMGPPSPLGPTSTLLDSLQEFRRGRRKRGGGRAAGGRGRTNAKHSMQSTLRAGHESREVQLEADNDASIFRESNTYSSWGDPGPDLGPAALRRNQTADIGLGR